MLTAEPNDASRHDSWRPVAAWILLGVFLRAVLASLVPLFPDETYYWEWSRRLEPGYFDHPPGIAYLIAFGRALFGDTTAAVRVGSAIAALVMQVAAVVAANQLGGVIAAKRAAILTTVLPLATLGLVLATPDAPLFACAMLALLCVDRALSFAPRTRASTLWWCAAGVALGAALLSKYTAVLLPASLFVAAVVHPALRTRFTEPGPYVATIIAALLFAPVVVWNAVNDWISFRFQLGHGFGSGAKGNVLTRELELLGGQLGLATPILAILLAIVTWRVLREGWRYRAESEPNGKRVREFALAACALGPLVFFAISATRRSVEPNWPALAYPGAILLLASSTSALALGKWWTRGVVLAGSLFVIASLQAWRPLLPLAPRKDPIARAHGWAQLASVVDSMSRDSFLDSAADNWIAAERYQDASELAFHLPGNPNVFALNIAGRANQYDLWPNAYTAMQPGDGLVVSFDADPAGDVRARLVATWFRDVHEGPTVALRRGSGEVAHRKVWLYRDAHDVPRDTGKVSLSGRNR